MMARALDCCARFCDPPPALTGPPLCRAGHTHAHWSSPTISEGVWARHNHGRCLPRVSCVARVGQSPRQGVRPLCAASDSETQA